MRSVMVEGVTRSPHAVRVQLAECVRKLVYSDYPQHWPELLPQVQQYLVSQASGWRALRAERSGLSWERGCATFVGRELQTGGSGRQEMLGTDGWHSCPSQASPYPPTPHTPRTLSLHRRTTLTPDMLL